MQVIQRLFSLLFILNLLTACSTISHSSLAEKNIAGLKAELSVYTKASTKPELSLHRKRLKQIEINLKRWETLSQELGDRYILVNVPNYEMILVDHNKIILKMKAIVGKPERPTPEINSTITQVIFNPYWNVPKLIAQKDIIPKILADPNYLDTMHIKILNRRETNATEINSTTINWQEAESNGFQYFFRQDPGVLNALGLVKFEFQNNADVYLHDTPAKELFHLKKRDLSSGCIRLERPFELVNYLMQEDPNWNEIKLQSILAGGKTLYLKTPRSLPIFLAYLTAWVDDKGQVEFREDIYGRDKV